MTVTIKDGLFTFGTQEIVEIPNDSAGLVGGIASTNDAVQKAPLGCLYRYKGNVYRYVLFDSGTGAVASAAYGVAVWKSLDPANGTFTATSAVASKIGKNIVAGIFGGSVTTGYYTWLQVGGVAMCTVADSTAVGDMMVYPSTDLTFDRLAAGTFNTTVTKIVFGIALESKAATTAGSAYVLLMGLIW